MLSEDKYLFKIFKIINQSFIEEYSFTRKGASNCRIGTSTDGRFVAFSYDFRSEKLTTTKIEYIDLLNKNGSWEATIFDILVKSNIHIIPFSNKVVFSYQKLSDSSIKYLGVVGENGLTHSESYSVCKAGNYDCSFYNNDGSKYLLTFGSTCLYLIDLNFNRILVEIDVKDVLGIDFRLENVVFHKNHLIFSYYNGIRPTSNNGLDKWNIVESGVGVINVSISNSKVLIFPIDIAEKPFLSLTDNLLFIGIQNKLLNSNFVQNKFKLTIK